MNSRIISIIVASCNHPGFSIDSFMQKKSLNRMTYTLEKKLQEDNNLQESNNYVIFLGDLIYIDSAAQQLTKISAETNFEKVHDSTNEIIKRILLDNNTLHRTSYRYILDDHELVNNWCPLPKNHIGYERNESIRTIGINAYKNTKFYKDQRDFLTQGSDSDFSLICEETLYMRETITSPSNEALAKMIFLNTRTDREIKGLHNVSTANIISSDQFKPLEEDLESNEDLVFIVSATTILPRHHRCIIDNCVSAALQSDSWDGYPASLCHLLCSIYKSRVNKPSAKIIFLSGDEHISSITNIVLADQNKNEVEILAICSSGLYCPLPFANTYDYEIPKQDFFVFDEKSIYYDTELHDSNDKYTCSTKTTFYKGDGFSNLDIIKNNDQSTTIKITFDRENAELPEIIIKL